MRLKYILLALLPSFLHVPIRRLMGNSIGKGTRIKFGTIIIGKQVHIAEAVSIGPFAMISAESISIQKETKIKSITLLSAKEIKVGEYVQIAPLAIISGDRTPNSKFYIGNHSRVFPFCWLDTGEGIKIGNHVGIGGHTLIFTHGVWTNFLEGGPVNFGGVEIEDEVWLPWRVFIMPNVTIGKKSIIGANSLITKSVAPNSLVAGSPAKVLKENYIETPNEQQQLELAKSILKNYVVYCDSKEITINNEKVQLKNAMISLDLQDASSTNIVFRITTELPFEVQKYKGMNVVDHPTKTAYIGANEKESIKFIKFLRRYGIRLSIIKNL